MSITFSMLSGTSSLSNLSSGRMSSLILRALSVGKSSSEQLLMALIDAVGTLRILNAFSESFMYDSNVFVSISAKVGEEVFFLEVAVD